MPALTEGAYQGDWLIEEFGAPNYGRSEVNVLAPVDVPSGAVIGTCTTLTTFYGAYDNVGTANTGKAAAAAGILLDEVKANAAMDCSIVDAADVGTGTTTEAHCLVVGDIIEVKGATDANLNVYATIASVPTPMTFTIATSVVADATYAVTIRKLNHAAVALVKGPAVVSAAGLDWDATAAAGITTGTAELLALNIKTVEGV
ncbi:MAG: hypothetical protein ABFD89_29710 [Bryobacteraceae bacterium]